MGHLAISHIYLKSSFTQNNSIKITNILQSTSHKLTSTRKGRVWIIAIHNQQSIYIEIQVHKTNEYSYEVEEQMKELKINTKDYPEVISIISSMGREIDVYYCEKISKKLALHFDCIRFPAKLVS